MSTTAAKLYTVGEVQDMLGVNQTTLSRWIRKGLISKIPGTNKITRAEYERFLNWQQEPKDKRRGRYNKKNKGAREMIETMTEAERLEIISKRPELINGIIHDLEGKSSKTAHKLMKSDAEIPELADHELGYIDEYYSICDGDSDPDFKPFWSYFVPLELGEHAKNLGAR